MSAVSGRATAGRRRKASDGLFRELLPDPIDASGSGKPQTERRVGFAASSKLAMNPFSSVEAIIWDMDGVLVDSEPLHQEAFLEVFESIGYGDGHGIHFPDYFGRSDRALWVDFIERHRPPYDLEQLAAWKQERFLKRLRLERPVFPGLIEALGPLGDVYSMALASGSSHETIRAVLDFEELQDRFAVVVSAQDVPNGKPSPEIFLRTAEMLGVTPDRCCVIEDSKAGVTAACRAGMPVFAITNSLPTEELDGATRIVSSYESIRAVLA